jgi:hypothetical protein
MSLAAYMPGCEISTVEAIGAFKSVRRPLSEG